MAPHRPDLVVFDYDGVLCCAETFTPDAIRAGLRRFGEVVGVDIAQPSEAELLGTLGYPSHQTYPAFLPEAVRPRWREMHRFTLDAMEERIRALGPRSLYPGAKELLDELAADGRILALASNSSERYQRVHSEVHNLARWFRHMLHAQMDGIGSKADMVGRILELEPEVQHVIMVGDRAGDRDAALAYGLPFVACTYGYGHEPEWAGAMARVDSVAELRAALCLMES